MRHSILFPSVILSGEEGHHKQNLGKRKQKKVLATGACNKVFYWDQRREGLVESNRKLSCFPASSFSYFHS